ncbi:MAG TPA: citrate/2-methylcitrate synthase [bacterium]|nr:citrate/2-methylcitrate synthase [bacterium]
MADEAKSVVVRGLEGVIAGETRVGYVDGVNGHLYFAGYEINELAGKVCYEEVVYLLHHNELPNQKQLTALRKELIAEMELPAPMLEWFKRVPKKTHPMALLRSAVSDLSMYDPDAEDPSLEANKRKALRLIAKIPVIIAGYHRIAEGAEILKPDPKKSLPENFLRMFLGRELVKEEIEAIGLMFVLHAEHDFNASTFAARVTASTLADVYAAITSAIATLQGPLHGGANQRVMEMLTDIGSPDDVDEYLDGMLNRREKIMGFGHREYKVEDPRARHLRKVSARLCERDRACHYYKMSELIERKVVKEKGIFPNVDFYSATVQHALGIPVRYYTTIFAASRIAGWTAHVLEQLADNKLMRPRSFFAGAWPRKFVPLNKRK